MASTRGPRTTCCRCRTTKSCTARARWSARCPATAGSSSPTCGRCSRTNGPRPARSCCSWAARSRSGASGTTKARSTGRCSTTTPTRASSDWSTTSTRCSGPSPRCTNATATPKGSGGRSPTTPTTACSASTGTTRAARRCCSSRTSRRSCATSTACRCPCGGFWRELVNTDAAVYGGSGTGNLGGVEAVPVPLREWYWSLTLQLPPLGALFLRPDP